MPVCLPTSRSGCSSGSELVLPKPNLPPALDLLPRVLSLGLLSLRNLALHYRLRHLPLRRIRIRAACMNRIHANIENVPATKSLR